MLRPIAARFGIFIFSFVFLIGPARADAELDRLYENASGAPQLAMIEQAKTSIDIEIYSMKDSSVFQALTRALDRGITLRIVQEPRPVADPCRVFDPPTQADEPKCREQKNFVGLVRSKGGRYEPFEKALCGPGDGSGMCYQHGKILIVDANLVAISTGNFDASSFCHREQGPSKCNRDYTVVSRDPKVVRAIRSVFEADLAKKTTDIPSILASAPRVTVSPHSLAPILSFLNSAKKTIQIQNQYLKNPDVNAALIRAAQRGVRVFVMVVSACFFGRPDQNAVEHWTRIYTAFDAAGIQTRVFNSSIQIGGLPGYLHAKAILIDSARAWVGSVNGSTTSLAANREYGIFSDEPAVVRDLGSLMYTDYVAPGAGTWRESLQCRPDHSASRLPEEP